MKTTITLIIDAIQNRYYITKLVENYPEICINVIPIQADYASLLNSIHTDIIGYIPAKATPISLLPENTEFPFIAACPPDASLPTETAKEIEVEVMAWMASTSIIKSIQQELYKLDDWKILNIANILEKKSILFHWTSLKATSTTSNIYSSTPPSPLSLSALQLNSKILAIVPHYRCEKWLRRCLQSLHHQTRPLDGIVVVDDASSNPPVSIVEEFPNVTLIASSQNVGPYRLVQQIVEETNFDAYLFQDADDWSSRDRVSILLQAAVATKSQLVGTQEFRVYEEECFLHPVCYPLDVNLALAEKPGHALLHPTSLVTRELVLQIGGFATGLKFGGDTEFLLRAAMVATIVNVPYYCYFRSKRVDSLTTALDTGLDSPARKQLLTILKARAYANYNTIKEGKLPCLTPLTKEAPIKLNYVTGPYL
ncbi:MAG: glycosyltransferase [Calothrix sp. C42_A2020_038]|nr:glycosyltransferase [Calothrix sp. C42_A2020_038]